MSICDWVTALPLKDSLSVLKKSALCAAREGGTVGHVILGLIQSESWLELCDFKLEYHEHWNVYELIKCRQALAFFQKLEPLPLGLDRERAAWEKFEQAEADCKLTNSLFRGIASGRVNLRASDVRLLEVARRKIGIVLGQLPNWESLNLRFGPGATTDVKKLSANPMRKFAAGMQCSEWLLHSGHLQSILRELPHWPTAVGGNSWFVDDEGWLTESVPIGIRSGVLSFVPKNAKSYRAIVTEPSINGLAQAGLGDHIAKRLRKVGVDIRDQTRNARLAREGSLTNELSTLDLSSASDTIAYELVRFLLPDRWFDVLNATRSHSVTYKRKDYHLEKFSSMGNGFTFPLETLIFWALTVAACDGDAHQVSVYGDDIICPSRYTGRVVSALQLCGFTVNTEKSFTDGPFRESCGHDYYKGFDIRPAYVKELVSCRDLFRLHNFFYRQHDVEAAERIKSDIPPDLRLTGPDGYGDGHLLDVDWLPSRKKGHVERGYGGWCFDTFSLGARREVSRYPGDWVSPLYSIYRRGDLSAAGVESPQQFDKGGSPYWGLPGSKGYKRISIYTLTR